ncbi:MAG: hypothetical protein QOF21_1948, partial [Actinomycetota bacterium]
IGLTLFDIGVAIWIIHALSRPRFDILGSPVLVRLGRLSYGMYLWHALIGVRVPSSYPAASVIRFVASYAVVVLTAEISYRFIELPFLRKKARFGRGEVAVL